MLVPKGIRYVDVGTSGGVWGLERGYCMMIGGPDEAVKRLDPIFKTLAPGRGDIPRTPGREKLGGSAEEGYIHCGPSGSGHFVKMVHNGIEYGVMQAYAEGFDILKNATSKELPEDIRYDLKLENVAEVWRRGSVISSWLLDLTAMALTENPTLSEYTGDVADSGEGRWTVRRRSPRRSRPKSLPLRCTRDFVLGNSTLLRKKFFPRCARSLAGISNWRRENRNGNPHRRTHAQRSINVR